MQHISIRNRALNHLWWPLSARPLGESFLFTATAQAAKSVAISMLGVENAVRESILGIDTAGKHFY